MFRALKLLFVVGIFLGPALGLACDTDLMILFTGKSPSDTFFQSIFRLASEAKDVGQASGAPEAVGKNVHQLMKTWIGFDNQFSQEPPPWARSDRDWQRKFKELADLIGNFDSWLRDKKLDQLHTGVLAFSRKLFGLLTAMPMPPEKRSLIRIVSDFQTLSVALEESAQFREGIEALASETREYRGFLASPALKLSQEFLYKVDQLEKLHLAPPASLPLKMSILVAVAESAFQKMNARAVKRSEGK